MCGRYTLVMLGQLGEAFEWVRIPDEFKESGPVGQARYNIAPSQEVIAVVAANEAGDQFKFDRLLWGLIPPWAKDPAIGNRLINARAETLEQKPAFRNAFKRQRCLIPTDGFYEWKKSGGHKAPYYIHMKDGHPFAFAGLWEAWHDDAGSEIRSCTIITTPPNELVGQIHDRMPAMFDPDQGRAWVGGGQRAPDELRAMLRPYPADAMEAYAVSRRVNSPKTEGPECVQRAADEPGGLWG